MHYRKKRAANKPCPMSDAIHGVRRLVGALEEWCID